MVLLNFPDSIDAADGMPMWKAGKK